MNHLTFSFIDKVWHFTQHGKDLRQFFIISSRVSRVYRSGNDRLYHVLAYFIMWI